MASPNGATCWGVKIIWVAPKRYSKKSFALCTLEKNSTAQTKRLCGCGGMVDTPDLGSGASNSVRVRVSPSAQ